MIRCQVTGVFRYAGNECIGSEQCDNAATYAFDTRDSGIVYRCEEHKTVSLKTWVIMTVPEAIIHEVLRS